TQRQTHLVSAASHVPKERCCMRHHLVFWPLLFLAFASAAMADVTYTFTGTPFGINDPQSLSLTTPNFISSVTKILAADLSSCSGSLTCVSVTFDPTAPDAGLLSPADEIQFEAENGVWNFFFLDEAFGTPGEYDNLDPTGNVGHLA